MDQQPTEPPAEGSALDLALASVAKLERRLERSRAESHALERLIEDKSLSLYLAQEELRSSKQHLEKVLASLHSAVLITDQNGRITSEGGQSETLTGLSADELVDRPVSSLLLLPEPPTDPAAIERLVGDIHEADLVGPDDSRIPTLVTVSTLCGDNGQLEGAVFSATDISERRRLEVELRHAQRLESIGQLAAGVAHEINTPIQYVGDGVRFIGESLTDLLQLVELKRPLLEQVAATDPTNEILARVAQAEEEIELPFLQEELPRAAERTLDGLDRVATIVRALKQFSHPGTDDLAPIDINAIIDNTLTVARSEYKYVAEVELHLGQLPDVLGDPGGLGQVFLNLIVNASHAIADREAETGDMGRITITTSADDDGVTVEVADTGGGIPEEVRERVFEPFFTTKEPGKGTGQGLAIAHNQVVKKHQGELGFEVEDGVGTTFRVWLPRKAEAS